ncbi:unnamed protein product [Paramecium octaurelia]|uniref:Uncharacterized protein n=1 Tax=Paramecium octaurelia TaxID=43137 RepID=A0A8S1UPM6_PAROT|nr:unnamed protein product [Paramecium octaurelia]
MVFLIYFSEIFSFCIDYYVVFQYYEFCKSINYVYLENLLTEKLSFRRMILGFLSRICSYLQQYGINKQYCELRLDSSSENKKTGQSWHRNNERSQETQNYIYR